MLRSLFELIQSENADFVTILLVLASYATLIFVTLPMHELAHAYVAHKLGDPTAKMQGRLTLNPLRHLDPIGTVMLLTVGFGYAKPVPVDPRFFRTKNKMTGMALTAAAGPLSNLLMAMLSLAAFKILCLVTGESVVISGNWLNVSSYGIYYAYLVLVQTFAGINLSLAVFNLLPVPPLDGSRILGRFLPPQWNYKLMAYERQITLVVFLLLAVGKLDTLLYFLQRLFGRLLCLLFGLPQFFG